VTSLIFTVQRVATALFVFAVVVVVVVVVVEGSIESKKLRILLGT
jgi:hypothetical protein